MGIRRTAIVFLCVAVLLSVLVILPVFALSEETAEVTGIWVPVSVEGLQAEDLTMAIPSQWGKMPEIWLLENGRAQIRVDGREIQEGIWKQEAADGEIRIESGDAVLFTLEAKGDTLFGVYETEAGQALNLVFGRRAEGGVHGEWIPVTQTQMDGRYYMPPVKTETLVLLRGGKGEMILKGNAGEAKMTDVRWQRQGNDVILSVAGTLENGAESFFPANFYQLDSGFLKAFSVRDISDVFTVWYARKGEEHVFTDVDNVRPLLNTAWELYAQDIQGVKVPLACVGSGVEEYLMFFVKGNGGLIHIENGEKTTLKNTFRLKDGQLHLSFSGDTDVVCRYADGQDLIREIGEGTRLFYRQKMIPEAQGIADGETTPLDLSISTEEGTRLRAGKTLQMEAAFADPEVVNRSSGNDRIAWSVTDPEGNEIPGVTIADDGRLKADKTVKDAVEAVVRARSESYGTTASCTVLIEPAK